MKNALGVPLELMSNLLLSILAFMEKTGMSQSDIEKTFQNCAKDMRAGSKSKRRDSSSVAIGCDTVAGAVLRAWHRDLQFVDRNADPLPLFLRRGKVNLQSLVHSQDKTVEVVPLIREMNLTGLIKKDARGRYLPTTSAATIGQVHPLAIDHVAKTVMRLVETVNRNMHSSPMKPSLIERYAHVPDLKPKEAQAFAEFARQQGAACLESIEDWLESRRLARLGSGRRSDGVSAGMHIFAYIADQQDTVSKTRPKQLVANSSRVARA